jgi:methionyl-tRNA formyltransferase
VRYAIVTSGHRNLAGLFLQRTAREPIEGASLAGVILCANRRSRDERRRVFRRRVRKAVRLGVIGTLNGIRMRRWYGADLSAMMRAPDIAHQAERSGIPLIRIESFRDLAAQEKVKGLRLDLGVSLGNGYIPKAFFEIPTLGMINIHHEWLPTYKGAQTALWQLHDGSTTSGYSIHEITTRIDGGRILYREHVPIVFHERLRDTVVETSAAVQRHSLDGLATVLGDFEHYRRTALPNTDGRSYTTPGGRALFRIFRNHARLSRAHVKAYAGASAS